MSSPSNSQPSLTFRVPIRRSTSVSSRRSTTLAARLQKRAVQLHKHGLRLFFGLTPLQRIALIAFGILSIVGGILSLVYHEQIFGALGNFAKGWRNVTGGWLILWFMTFFVAFPPLIGYSTCVMLGGFVYGFPNGWFLVASASTLGATAAFLASRSILQPYVHRLVSNDPRFAALALVLKHDGLKLLCMIRLCPLPFSLSNGALSTVPTISWSSYMLATALVSPKLMLHVYVGHQLAELAENGDKMDAKTKAVSYASIVIGTVMGAVTGWLIYAQTKRRTKELEELERLEAGEEEVYVDEPEEESEDVAFLRELDDDISLRSAWDEEGEYFDESSASQEEDSALKPGSKP